MANEITPANLSALCRFAALGGRCCAPRPGSNTIGEIEFGGPGGVKVTGQEMDTLHHAGYLLAEPTNRLRVLADDEERGEVKADHEWKVSPAGWTEVNKALENHPEPIRKPISVITSAI